MKSKTGKMLAAVLMMSAIVLSSGCSGKSTPPPVAAGQTEANTQETGAPAQAEAANEEELKAEDGAVIKFAYWEGSPSDTAAWKAVLDRFRKDHPEIELVAEAYPSKTFRDQLDTMIAGNEWPDVMRYTYQRLGKFKEADVMLDLTGKISQETLDDLIPAYKEALTYNGKLVGLPHHTDTIAIFYNKKMFEEAGIRIPKNTTDGWSLEELTEISRKLKAEYDLDTAFSGIWENGNGYRFLPLLYMNGGKILSDDGTEIAVNSPETLEVLTMLGDWTKEGLMPKASFLQDAQTNMMFSAQKTAFVFAGSWHTTFMDENFKDGWAVTYMPQVNGKTTSDLGGNGLFAYKETKYPNACAIFIDYIARKDNMKLFCEEGNFIPVSQSLIAEGLEFKNFPEEMKVFLEIAATVDPKMAQDETSSRFQQLNVIWCEQTEALIVNGSVSPEDTMKNLEEKMQEALDE